MNSCKKILCILLCVSLIFTFSCTAKNDNIDADKSEPEKIQDQTSTQTTTEELLVPDLPETSHNGYELRILNISPDSSLWWSTTAIDAAEQTGDIVNDAIYLRNRAMESKYDFKIKLIELPDEKMVSAVKNTVGAGLNEYDIVIPPVDKAGTMAVSGMLHNLRNVKHIDFTKPWWNLSTQYNYSIMNKLYFATSDFTLTNNDANTILMYNKNIASDIGTPSDEEMYDIVESGKWTQDLFFETAKKAVLDMNGNGTRDMGDRFGIAACGWAQAAFMGACNQTFTSKDSDDLPVFTCDNEKYIQIFDKVASYMRDQSLVVYEYTDFNATLGDLFMNDYALFALADMSCVRLYRAMTSDFAVLPFPKYNEAQDKYYSFMVTTTCITIPVSNTTPDIAGFCLEALSAESRRVVIPAYYEYAVAKKYFRDDKSFKVLETILENPVLDTLYWIYQWGGFNGQYDVFAQKGKTELASLVEKNKAKVEAAIKKTIDTYALLP